MALLAMLDMQDSLIILDEPEVHFNDYWKREVVKFVDETMQGFSNHLLITTHSSILLSDVTENQVNVFVKNPSGITEQRRPGIKTFGADPSEIMMVTFDTELSSGAKSEEELITAIHNGDRAKVAGLLEMIGPGMWRFRLKQRLEEIDAASA
jgi:energy-coupling factor transporter ATP-binding protein EcfA2